MLALLPQWRHSIRQYLRLTVWIQRPRRTTCFLPKLRGQRGWAVTFVNPNIPLSLQTVPKPFIIIGKYPKYTPIIRQNLKIKWTFYYTESIIKSELDLQNPLLQTLGSSPPISGPFSSYTSQDWPSSPSNPLSSPFLGLVGSSLVSQLTPSPWHLAQKAV